MLSFLVRETWLGFSCLSPRSYIGSHRSFALLSICFLHHCLKQSLIPQWSSLLCQKYTTKIRKPPLTFTLAWAILPSLPEIETLVPSSSPTTAPKLLSTATKTCPDVCFFVFNVCSFIGGSCCVSCNLYPPLASLLNCSSISSFLSLCSIPKKDIALSFVSSHSLFLCTPRRSVEQGTPQQLCLFLHFSSVFSFWLPPPLKGSLPQTAFL